MKKEKKEIIEEINQLASITGSYIDAIVEICYRHSIEEETMAQYIRYSKDMKESIRLEGLELNMIKRDEE